MRPVAAGPPRDCALCPRLAAFRGELHERHPGWFNAPVPSFGDPRARLLIVGLAPGKAGANRTGRPFTGDFAGDLLYDTLQKYGLAEGSYDKRPDDGLRLRNCRVTNAVRCVPPANRPTGTETRNCRQFLEAEIAYLSELKAILALGRVAHDTCLSALGAPRQAHPFRHGALHDLDGGPWLADSFHCSRLNTNTGRLTAEMFEAVIAEVCRRLDA